MEKLLIHTVPITIKLERNLFQIVLPENAEAITGIAVTTDLYKVPGMVLPEIGKVRLYAADTGDKFFAEELHAVSYPSRMETQSDFFVETYSIAAYKKQFELQDTYQPVSSTLIEGFYEDYSGVKFTGGLAFGYNVRIYLKLQLKTNQ